MTNQNSKTTPHKLSTIDSTSELVNDRHSQLNPTRVKHRISPKSPPQLVEDVKQVGSAGEKICVAGGRHAMGGQQFLQSGVLLDMTDMNRIINFDSENGFVEVESGCLWSQLIPALQERQEGRTEQWTIAQKQTGCDRLSIGGALAANAHGRGLSNPPIVPRSSLGSFLYEAAELLREEQANVIYGTVRLIEKDEETFLAWAKEPWACTVLNLHVNHQPRDIAHAGRTFCKLIDLAIKYDGSYYLTYHRFASRQQMLTCYKQMPLFLKLKAKYDPAGLFCSDWFEYCKKLSG